MHIPREDFDKAQDYLSKLTPAEKHDLVQMAITDEEFNDLFKREAEHTKEYFLKEGEIITSVHAIARATPKDKFQLTYIAVPGGFPVDTPEEHDNAQRALGNMIAEDAKFNLVALMASSEAWGLKQKAGEPEYHGDFGKHPDRFEALFLMAATIDGRRATVRWTIKRDAAGKVIELIDDVFEPYVFDGKPTQSHPMLRRIFEGYSIHRFTEKVK